MIEYIVGIGIGFGVGILLAYLLLRREVETREYDLLVVVTPKGKFWVLKNATVQDKSIAGTDVLASEGNTITLSWHAEQHPKDFIVEHSEDGRRMGLLFVASNGNSLAPIMKLEEFLNYVQRRELIGKMEALLVHVQSAKMDQYSRFFDVYERLVRTFFGDDIIKHMRAAGALCAKFPTLRAEFIKGYVAAKLALGASTTEEDVKEWLENPTDAYVTFAKLVAEELAKMLPQVKKNGG